MQIKLSVIVPIYNVEPYVEKCVRSLMEQTMKDGIEFVFVDDATPDRSMAIVHNIVGEYPERTHQIKIIHNTENLGITQTRARGIEMAEGEYIGWCDADDWCEHDMFEKMYEATKDASVDIVICNYKDICKDGVIEKKVRRASSPQECLSESYRGRYYSGCLWNQIFRSFLLKKYWNNVIPTNFGEDTFAIWYIYYHASSCAYVDDFLYNYNQMNVESLVHRLKINRETWLAQQENLIRIRNLCFSSGGWTLFHKALNYMAFTRKHLFMNSFRNPKEFFYTFRDASRDVWFFPGMTKINRCKIYIINNIYLLFWIKHNSKWVCHTHR